MPHRTSGKQPSILDPRTGARRQVELFVAVLGASNYTYAEATYSQSGPDWIASHLRALEFFGGAPKTIVCDQLKSGVTRSCRYEPQVQAPEALSRISATTTRPRTRSVVLAAEPRCRAHLLRQSSRAHRCVALRTAARRIRAGS
jgi:transposase